MTKGTTMEMEAMKDEEALAEQMPWQQFVTKCPECGGQLYLSSYSIVLDKGPAIYPDGFDVGGGKGQHTDDETVMCRDCRWHGDLMYVDSADEAPESEPDHEAVFVHCDDQDYALFIDGYHVETEWSGEQDVSPMVIQDPDSFLERLGQALGTTIAFRGYLFLSCERLMKLGLSEDDALAWEWSTVGDVVSEHWTDLLAEMD